MLEALIAAIGQSAKAQGNTFWTRKLTMGTPVQVHLAVMVEPYLSRVLDGSKTRESRFSRKKIAPWGRVSSGNVVVLKKSGGSFVAVFEATAATYVELSPDSMAQIRQTYGQALCVNDAFWQAKAECSFATLISMGHLFVFPPFSLAFRNRRSWVDLGTFTGQPTSAGEHLEAHCNT